MSTLVTSPWAEARIQHALRELASWSREPEVTILAPTRGAGDDFARRAGRSGLYRYSPLQLALELGTPRLAERGRVSITGMGLRAVTLRAIHRARVPGLLDYFDRIADTPGFARVLEHTLGELRMDSVAPEALEDLGPSGRDLRILLDAFAAELAEGKLADPPAIYEAAREHLLGGSETGAARPVLLLDILPEQAVEERFIEALRQRSASVSAVAMPSAGRGLVNLEAALKTRACALAEPPPRHTLERIRTWVFSRQSPKPTPSDTSFTFFSATDEGRECAEVTRHIHAEAARGRRFDDIAVLLRDPDTYQPLLEDAMKRAGIPVWCTGGTERPNPSGRAFLSLLACRSEDFSASRFAEFLSLGQVPDPAEGLAESRAGRWTPGQGELFGEEPPPPPGPDTGRLTTPDRWEQLLVDASVVGGRERWQHRLEGLREELSTQAQAARTEDEARFAYLCKQLERLDQLQQFALPVIEMLAALPETASWEEWLDRLESLAELTLRRPEHVLSALGQLRPMNPIGPITLEDVERVLEERLSMLRTDATGRRYGCVFVSTITEAAGRSFGIVFVPGLSEGIFPQRAVEDPLLLDDHRKQSGHTLKVNRDRVQHERTLLQVAVGAARDRLWVSYPRMDVGQGRARVPSFYALDVLRAAEGTIPDLGELERRAVEESRSRLGWPSPIEAGEAIDDTEYDLATIGTLLQRSPTEVHGRARYLIETHAILRRSLRTRARRWKNFWSAADGLVDPQPDARELLEANSLRRRAYSATSLEQFASCPYKFLLHSIHRLHPRREIVRIERMDPLTRGQVFHSVQFRLLTRLSQANLLPVTRDNVEAVNRHLDKILDSTAREYEVKLAPAIGRVFETEIEILRSDLRGWLLREAEKATEEPGWEPSHFELSFGLKTSDLEADPDSRPEDVVLPNGFLLHGSIDLIEENRGASVMRIVDHKTGRPPTDAPLATGNGEVLQPILYAMAAEALLGMPVTHSRLSFCTQIGDFRQIEISVNDEARRRLIDILSRIEGALESGFLPAAPRPGACLRCGYRIVCGPYEELRIGRKQRARLEALDEIRSMN